MEIKNGIYHVGIRAKKIHTFDFSAKNVFINAYIARGEKTALIDTVPEEHGVEFMEEIEKIIPIEKIDYLICNHTEQGHSGCVKKIIEKNPDIKVFATVAGLKNLKAITNIPFDEHPAKDGHEIDLGSKTLRFIITPNLPWPDTMVTYCPEEKALFSGDIFSSAYCGEEVTRIPDKAEHERQMKDFYDVKTAGFNDFAKTAAKRIGALDIEIICTGLGAVLSGKDTVSKYAAWSRPQVHGGKTAAVIYASAYGSTKEMAKIIADELNENGVAAKLFDCAVCGSRALEEIHCCDALIFGSPTVNRNAVMPVWEAVLRLNAISDKGKPYFVFGSYGWSGEALTLLNEHLKKLRLGMFDKPFGCNFKPSGEDKAKLREYVRRFGAFLGK